MSCRGLSTICAVFKSTLSVLVIIISVYFVYKWIGPLTQTVCVGPVGTLTSRFNLSPRKVILIVALSEFGIGLTMNALETRMFPLTSGISAFPLISRFPIISPLKTVCFNKNRSISGHKSASPGNKGIISSALDLFIVTLISRLGIFDFSFVIFPEEKALIPLPVTCASLICKPFLIVETFDFKDKRPLWWIDFASISWKIPRLSRYKFVFMDLWPLGSSVVCAVRFIIPDKALILSLDNDFAYIEKSDKSRFTIWPEMSHWSSVVLFSGSLKSISDLIKDFFFPVWISAIVEKSKCLLFSKLFIVRYLPSIVIFFDWILS